MNRRIFVFDILEKNIQIEINYLVRNENEVELVIEYIKSSY